MPDTVFNFSTSGGQVVVGTLQQISKQLELVAQENIDLAKATGLSEKEAARLATSLGLTAKQATDAAKAIGLMEKAGVSNADKFKLLNQSMGLTIKQFETLNQKAKIPPIDDKVFKSVDTFNSGIGGLAFQFNNVIAAAKNLQATLTPLFEGTIGAVDRFNSKLLAAQTTLSATTKITQNGKEISGIEAIQVSADSYRKTFDLLREETKSLAGITDQEIEILFSSVNNQVGNLVGQSKKIQDPLLAVEKITRGIAATAGTAKLPFSDVNFQIQQILAGTGDLNENKLLKTIRISKDQVELYRSQGILVDKIIEKTNQFVDGNKLAAKSIENIQSNFVSFFDQLGRKVGEPLFEPLIDSLQAVYDFLSSKQNDIADGINTSIKEIQEFIQPIIDEIIKYLTSAIEAGKKSFEDNKEVITELATTVGGILRDAFVSLLNLFLSIQTALRPLADGFIKIFGPGFVLILKGVGAALNVIELAIGKIAEGGVGLSKVFAGAIDTLDKFNVSIRKAIGQGLQQAFESVPKPILAALEKIGLLPKDFQLSLERMARTGDAFKEEFKSVGASLGDGLKSADFQISKKPLEDLGDTGEAITKKLKNALSAVARAGEGEIQQATQNASDAIKLVDEGIEKGAIGTEEAISDLRQIVSNTKLLPETRLQAEKAITKIIQDESQIRAGAVDTSIKQTEALVAGQQISEAEGDKRLTDLKIEQLQIRAAAQKRIAEQAGADSKVGKAALQQEAQIQAEILKLRGEFEQREIQRRIKNIEIASQKALDAVKKADVEQQIEIARLEQSTTTSKFQIEQKKFEATKKRLDGETKATKDQIAALEALPKPNDPVKAAEREAQIRQLYLKTFDLQKQGVEAQGQREQSIREETIRQIKRQSQAQQIATDEQVRGLSKLAFQQEAVAKSIDLQNKSLERQQSLLKASQGLEKAISDAKLSAAEQELQAFDKAADIRKQLAETDNPEKKAILQKALNDLGQSGQKTQLQLLQERQRIEDKIAAQKLQNLREEQARQRASLELDLRRQDLAAKQEESAAKRAVIEAQIAESKARQTVADAKAQLEEAKQIKDPEERKAAIDAAQNQIKEAQQNLELAGETTKQARGVQGEATAKVQDQAKLAEDARATLKVQQDQELKVAQTADNFREVDQALALADAKAQQFAQTLAAAAASSQAIKDNLSGAGAPAGKTATPPPIRKLYTGGDVAAGEPVIVGDRAGEWVPGVSEVFVPRVAGTVLSSPQVEALRGLLIPQQFSRIGSLSQPGDVVNNLNQSEVVSELKGLRNQLATVGRPNVQVRNEFSNDPDPNGRVHTLLRDLMRMR